MNESDDVQEPQCASAAILHDSTVSPRDDRKKRGLALRAAIPLESHAGWRVSPERKDVLEILAHSNEGRIKELIPVRFGRMSHSAFAFFRGSASVMAADLSTLPTSNVKVQACGDCHLLNFGAFATPERNVAFDLNDFDETLPAPWEYDLKRLVVSFVLAARENELKPKHTLSACKSVVEAYRTKMAEYARMSILDIWYDRIDWQHIVESTSSEELQKKRANRLRKAAKQNSEYYFPKLVDKNSTTYLIKDNPPRIFHPEDKGFNARIEAALLAYAQNLQEDKRRLFSRYRFEDSAIKVVGIGSVGTMCAIALLLAPDEEPLFLQIKEARNSVLEPYVGKSTFDNAGRRVVEGQRIMQSASDIFLGWTEFDNGKHFYVRQLRDTKIKLEPQLWDGKVMVEMASIMGSVLARAHARSGDSATIAGYLGDDDVFDNAVADFALSYANQVDKDYSSLIAAIESGRIETIEE